MQHETDRTAKRQRRDWGSEPVYRGLEAHRTTASDHGPAPMSINQLLLHQPLPAPPVLFSTQDSYGNQDLDLGNPDSFASPAATSSIHTDEYAINPRFLVASEQLHSLQITSAQSNAPTRAPSPDPQLGKSEEKLSGCHKTSMRILCSRQRQNYLKNYMKNVAPWVSSIPSQLGGLADRHNSLICLIFVVISAYSYLSWLRSLPRFSMQFSLYLRATGSARSFESRTRAWNYIRTRSACWLPPYKLVTLTFSLLL